MQVSWPTVLYSNLKIAKDVSATTNPKSERNISSKKYFSGLEIYQIGSLSYLIK